MMLRPSVLLLVLSTSILPAGCQQRPQTADSPTADAPLTQADFSAAQRLLRLGIAHLENKEWEQSELALTSLEILLPDNNTVLRNQAILRVLFITDAASPLQPFGTTEQQKEFVQAVHRAEEAIRGWRTSIHSDEEAAIADLIHGVLQIHTDRPDAPSLTAGLASLRQAVSRQPQRADLNMALALALTSDPAAAESPDLLQQFVHTFQLAPDNLYALQQLLQQQALSLQSGDDAARELAGQTIRSTLTSAVSLIAPLNNTIRAHAQTDLVALLNGSLADESSDPAALIRPAMIVANLIKSETPVQIDRRRIDRHLLEYVEPRFDSQLRDRFQPSEPAAATTSVLTGFHSQASPLADGSDVTDVQVTDFTLDGTPDLIVVRGGIVEVYTRPQPESPDWSRLMQIPESEHRWTSCRTADLDRDYETQASRITHPVILEDADVDRRTSSAAAAEGRWVDTDPDLIVWNTTALHLIRNSKDDDGRRFPEPIQLFELADITDVAVADSDADGDLDLFVATSHGVHLLTNRNGSSFEEQLISEQPLTQLAIGDIDRNVAIDVAGIASTGGPGLLQNLFHNRFRWLSSEDVFGSASTASRLAIGDFDGNLSWDVVCSGSDGIVSCLTRTGAPGVVSPLATIPLTDHATTELLADDFDNDGYLDIAALTSSGLKILRGTGDGEFRPLPLQTADVSGSILRSADLDKDGDRDLLVVSDSGSLELLSNEGGHQNQWMKLVVRGAENNDQFNSLRVNMHGIGTVVEVMAGSAWQSRIVTEPVMHLGLGQASQLDTVRLIWPNGVPQNITTDRPLQQHVRILAPQILKGSCPYLYAWSGEQFEFVSDCLWAAPIGLVQASGDLAPMREWEHLLITADQLAERDSCYELQITEELWEVAYFDQIQLLAVDHPQNVQIFTNEKVGPPELARHQIHTVRDPLTPQTVTDGQGNDLLPELRRQDGIYAAAFETRHLQGLTDEWTMEFDLGILPAADTMRLFLTGWVFPTDTSLNLQIRQNPDLSAPVPPSIEVLNADGHWQTAVPFIGFPGGKTKTMVVDLSHVVGPDRSRFRIRSSMELYFDHIFYTTENNTDAVSSQTCTLTDADLHDRGFSRRNYGGSVFRDSHGPEGYDYQHITTDQRWPTISGPFTRYGTVTELVTEADDRLAVLGPGDELTLRFAVPENPPPDGWTRSFVLRNTGWDKDADLNTVYGQSSEPYPFRAMTHYPFSGTDLPPASAEYRKYREQYQTREYSAHRYRNAVRVQGLSGPSQ